MVEEPPEDGYETPPSRNNPDRENTDTPASEQFDLTHGTTYATTLDEIQTVARGLEEAEAYDPDAEDTESLAEIVAALNRLENAAEDARKEVFEDALDDRVDEGESIGPLVKQSGSSTWVTDDEAALAAVSEAGEDPLDVASVSIGDLRDVLGAEADEYIGSSSYSYFRRQS